MNAAKNRQTQNKELRIKKEIKLGTQRLMWLNTKVPTSTTEKRQG